jgi:hypothetical protein
LIAPLKVATQFFRPARQNQVDEGVVFVGLGVFIEEFLAKSLENSSYF